MCYEKNKYFVIEKSSERLRDVGDRNMLELLLGLLEMDESLR